MFGSIILFTFIIRALTIFKLYQNRNGITFLKFVSFGGSVIPNKRLLLIIINTLHRSYTVLMNIDIKNAFNEDKSRMSSWDD